MKRKVYRLFSYLFIAAFFVAQISIVLALDDVGVVDGRLVNVTEPINENDVANKKYVDDSIDMLPEPPAVLKTLGQSDTAAISQKAVTDAMNNIISKQEICDIIYPIESIYMSLSSVNPSVLFGGVWEQIENKFLFSSGSSYSAGDIGGNTTISLVSANIPGHTHSFSATTGSNGGSHTHSFSATTSTIGTHRHLAGMDYDGGSGSSRWTVHNTGSSGAQQQSPTSYDNNHSHTVSGTTGSANHSDFNIEYLIPDDVNKVYMRGNTKNDLKLIWENV